MNAHRIVALVGALALALVGSAAAVFAIIALTNDNVLVMACEQPEGIRCSDHFFLGDEGYQNTLGSTLIAGALLLWFSAGVVVALAAGVPTPRLTRRRRGEVDRAASSWWSAPE
jgi:hypothetical protein